jgi:hypothetical protein
VGLRRTRGSTVLGRPTSCSLLKTCSVICDRHRAANVFAECSGYRTRLPSCGQGNAPGDYSPVIADWLQPLASPNSSGAFPRYRRNAPSATLQLSTALYSSLQLSITLYNNRAYLSFIPLCLPASLRYMTMAIESSIEFSANYVASCSTSKIYW